MRKIKRTNQLPVDSHVFYILLLFLFFMLLSPLPAYAEESVCAEVKIEIVQELTLERQGFDAHMKINNGLAHITLENVMVEVTFDDAEGNPVLASSDSENTGAVFFIREDSEGITDNGDGSWDIEPVGPSSASDLHWLIVPSLDASNDVPEGTLYFVGAKLTYTIGGEEHITIVTPDYIYVKPMPELQLDYFLTSQVIGDDPWTTDTVEAPEPFTLGLRVKNAGFGIAKDLKIDSAQPKIKENEQGLLIGFVIESCEVNGGQASKSLLADLGDIGANEASVARWSMSCTLSGEFIDFDAKVIHSDELGGSLTSLITAANTHFLTHDVIVDLPGRDSIVDFLAYGDGSYKVYESDGNDADVLDQSASASLGSVQISGTEATYAFSIPQTAGCVYAKVLDPYNGEKELKSVRRSDNKVINPRNIWISKTQDDQTHEWTHYVNIFDVNTTGSYALVFDAPEAVPQAPVLQFIEDKQTVEEQTLSFIAEASDPDGTIPALTVSALPAGAQFTDNQNGTGTFSWTPAAGQYGSYNLTFRASDGTLTDSQIVNITVCSIEDTDCDGMADAWEIANFGDLSRDGTGDYDGDGISDLMEFLFGSNPLRTDHAPTMPEINAPSPDGQVDNTLPELAVDNSTDADGDSLVYEFQLYSDAQMTQLVEEALDVSETTTTTAWQVSADLSENTWYYWRVRASDGIGYSLWNYGSFFVNTQNEPPGPIAVNAPDEATHTDSVQPVLSVTNCTDPDQDAVSYVFTVYSDAEMTVSVASSGSIAQEEDATSWQVTPGLIDNTTYYWRAVAADPSGEESGITSSFYVQTGNLAPSALAISWPDVDSEINTLAVNLEAAVATDPENDALYYIFEIDTVPTFDSAEKLTSEALTGTLSPISWPVSGLTENTRYYWRVKANDGAAESPWANGVFYVNTVNESPACPAIKNPGDAAWVNSVTPQLLVVEGTDPDDDELFYTYELYSDASLTDLVYTAATQDTQALVDPALDDHHLYYWRVQAEDEDGEISEWSPVHSFFAVDDGINDPPELAFTSPSENLVTNDTEIEITWTDADPDRNALIALYYDTDDTGEDGFLIADAIEEDMDGDDDAYSWDVSALEGVYYIYAVISDELSSVTVYSQGIVIDRTPAMLTADVASGTYGGPQFVSLSTDEPADIYYTLDGSVPTQDATLYDGAIEVAESLTITAICVDAAGNVSVPAAFAYTIEENISVQIKTDAGLAMAGLRVYAFTESGSYTGNYCNTNDQGLALFDPASFSEGNFKFRIDYLGHQFWTDILAFPSQYSISHSIEMETVTVSVDALVADTSGVRVYLFSETGSYLNVYANTDENGQVTFELPAGVTFKFRADVLGSQYFSAATLIDGESANAVSVDVGGGALTVTLQEDAETPMGSVRIYLFNEAGSYLNQNQVSTETGNVVFNVSEGTYKVRADYLGYQFWSDPVSVGENIQMDLTIPHTDVTVSLNGSYQGTDTPIENIRMYLFTVSGSYQNQYRNTDAQGTVMFHLPDKAYKIRADILGQQYWSSEFTSSDTVLTIPMADAQVLVTRDGQPVADVTTYLFTTSGSYLNLSQATGADGTIIYRLPAETYKFRADYLGDQYWSEESPLTADQANPVEVNTGGGRFELTVLRGIDQPLEGATCYLFNSSGAYLNHSAITSSEGYVSFDLADGEYQVRVNHLGYEFWTPVYAVPQTLTADFTITHTDVEISVNGIYQEAPTPMADIKVYLYNASGSYMNQNLTTDAAGKVFFSLPNAVYKVRADVVGDQHWSGDILSADTGVDIPMADARVTISGAGQAIEGLPVYVYSESGSYLNLKQYTDSQGQTVFRLPANTYDFRADFQGSQFWADDLTLAQDVANAVDINTGGGEFSLTVLKNATDPLTNTRCYLYNEAGSYLNLYQNTSSEGVVTFNLADGNYKVRVDHLGYQFWTPVFTVPDTLDEVFVIDCQDFTVSIQGLYLTAAPVEGIRVYLYKPTASYQNQYQVTDALGQVIFNLPDQPYRVRADYLGYQFWTDAFQFQDTTLTINQGQVSVRVHRSDVDVPDAKVYLYTESGSYQNWYETTDASGLVSFILPAENYKFRADEGGDQIYSSVVTVQSGTTEVIEIDLDQ